jgi:hypothetical protein
VRTDVLVIRVATTIAQEPGQGVLAAGQQRLAKHIQGLVYLDCFHDVLSCASMPEAYHAVALLQARDTPPMPRNTKIPAYARWI